jgi:PilZ domain-containing protein
MSRVSSRPDFGYIDAERRKDPRKTVRIAAEITIGDSVQCDCTIINISQGGALLVIPAGFVLPDQFMLIPPSRLCRVAWRKEDRVGVAFQADESFMDM